MIAALRVSESMQDTMTFEHYHVSIRHLVCTNVLVYAHACVFVTCRSNENKSVHGCMYIYIIIHMYVCFCDCNKSVFNCVYHCLC